MVLLPRIEMKIRVPNRSFLLTLDDPYQFDQVFSEVDSEPLALQIKIHYCNMVYKIAKNKAKNQRQLHEFLLGLLMKYQAMLIFT